MVSPFECVVRSAVLHQINTAACVAQMLKSRRWSPHDNACNAIMQYRILSQSRAIGEKSWKRVRTFSTSIQCVVRYFSYKKRETLALSSNECLPNGELARRHFRTSSSKDITLNLEQVSNTSCRRAIQPTTLCGTIRTTLWFKKLIKTYNLIHFL